MNFSKYKNLSRLSLKVGIFYVQKQVIAEATTCLIGAFMLGSKPPVLPGERERAERQ